MRRNTSDHTPVTPGMLSRRVGVMLLGVLAGAASISGCANSSTPSGSTTVSTITVTADPSATAGTPAQLGSPGASSRPSAQSPITPSQAAAPPITSIPSTTTQQPGPNHPASGTTIAGAGLTAAQAADLQKSVDAGHQPWRLDRIQVAKSFMQGRFGWTNTQTSTGAPMVVFVTNQDGSAVALHLTQPATQGDHGIWVVDSGVWR